MYVNSTEKCYPWLRRYARHPHLGGNSGRFPIRSFDGLLDCPTSELRSRSYLSFEQYELTIFFLPGLRMRPHEVALDGTLHCSVLLT